MRGLCHRCNTSNVGIEVKEGVPICKECLERQAKKLDSQK